MRFPLQILLGATLLLASCAKQQVVVIHGREYERPTKEEIKSDLDAKVYNDWINAQLKKQKWWYREKKKKGRIEIADPYWMPNE